MKRIRVTDLFAGVGGFRLGLERASDRFETVFANQWEPNKKKQWAYECYISHWKNHKCICEDINNIDKESLPDFDLLVGGHPCQNFSIGASTKYAKGLEGTKGVLWYQIYEILKIKQPKAFLLENVDRMLKSPSNQRGRDFGIMLYHYNKLGYKVEWRVVNSANYGSCQRRKRVFVFGFRESFNPFFNKIFPTKCEYQENEVLYKLFEDILNFKFDFKNWGYMEDGEFITKNVEEIQNISGKLADVIQKEDTGKRYLTQEQIKKFKYLKGSKKLKRVTKEGYEYNYSEGAMAFPDNLDLPSRTMLTSEGSVNRCSHVVNDNGLRFLTPVECERLNSFPDRWTEGMPDRMRYFCMGNALVVSLIERIGSEIVKII